MNQQNAGINAVNDLLPQIAVIRESDCIGCAKCIQACPVDAIIGAGKLMHTVIADVCTGCGLCIPPCPVDCIDLIPSSNPLTAEFSDASRRRREKRESRLAKEKNQRQDEETLLSFESAPDTEKDRQAIIEASVLRARAKKLKL